MHENDGGRCIRTGTYNVTQDPDPGWYDMGYYRMMVIDEKTVAYNSAPGKYDRIHNDKYVAQSERVLLGGYAVPSGARDAKLRGKSLPRVTKWYLHYGWMANVEF